MRRWRSSQVAVIPVHNEASSIAAIVTAVQVYLPVIVVDDASDDGSGQLAAVSGAMVLTLPSQRGKGMALRQGFRAALRCGVEAVVTLDGDGQHDPQDIPRLLMASRRWPDSLIIGGRLEAVANIPRHRLQAIRVASFWINWMGDCQIQDTQSGFRLYPAAMLRTLTFRQGGYLLESEVLLRARWAGYDVHELPIRATYLPGQRSQYRPLRDGTMATAYLFYHGMGCWPTQLRRLLLAPGVDAAKTRAYVWRRTLVALLAMGVLPVLLLAMLVQCLVGRMGYDVLTPLIRRFYDHRLLIAPPGAGEALHGHDPYDQWEFI